MLRRLNIYSILFFRLLNRKRKTSIMRVTLGLQGSRVQLITQIMEVQEKHWEPGLFGFLLSMTLHGFSVEKLGL